MNIALQILTAIAQFATGAGFLLLFWQIRFSRRAAETQLINELEKEFSTYANVFAKLKPGGAWHSLRTDLTVDDIAQLETLASFCEKLEHFRNRGIMGWKTLNLMFRNRYFLIMHNTNVITHVVMPCPQDWEAALTLEREWIDHLPPDDARRETGSDILRAIADTSTTV